MSCVESTIFKDCVEVSTDRKSCIKCNSSSVL